MVAECARERAEARYKVRERVSGTDRGRKGGGRESRRCDALPRVEVIDRGCNENGGVTRRVRGCRGGRREERGGRRNGAEERGRNARRARKRRRGGECKRRPLEGFACSCIDRRRLSCASAPPCISPPLLPPPVPYPPPNPHPVGGPLLLWQSIALSSPSLPSFPLRPPTAPSFLLALTPFSLKPSLAPLAARTSRNHRINDVGVTGDAVRAAPVNVTLKTEGEHVHTYSGGCAVRKRASARGAILYIRARDGH